MRKINCKFCGNLTDNNMQGYCQVCYKYFVLDNKKAYPLPKYAEIEYTDNGDCICHMCGKAYRKLGGHIVQAHHITTAEYMEQFGLHTRKSKISNESYRKHMNEIQQPKCITENLLEKGKNTRFYAVNGNIPELPIHSMKDRCKKCVNLGNNWYCKTENMDCKLVMKCTNKEIK